VPEKKGKSGAVGKRACGFPIPPHPRKSREKGKRRSRRGILYISILFSREGEKKKKEGRKGGETPSAGGVPPLLIIPSWYTILPQRAREGGGGGPRTPKHFSPFFATCPMRGRKGRRGKARPILSIFLPLVPRRLQGGKKREKGKWTRGGEIAQLSCLCDATDEGGRRREGAGTKTEFPVRCPNEQKRKRRKRVPVKRLHERKKGGGSQP